MSHKKSDSQLLSELHQAAQKERDITLQVIALLEQAEERKLYLNLGYGSLIEFCIQELKYSESAAYRRISAMRAVKEIPQLQKKIETGSLSLAVVAQAQSHIRQSEKRKPMSLQQKLGIFESLQGLTSRQAEKELLLLNPQILELKESLRQITPELQKLTLILDEEMQKDLKRLQEVLSHQMPGASLTDVLKFAVKDLLKKRDMMRKRDMSLEGDLLEKCDLSNMESDHKTSVSVHQISAQKSLALPAGAISKKNRNAAAPAPVSQKVIFGLQKASLVKKYSRINLPEIVKRLVWQKSQGQCCYYHEGRRCNSRFQLEIDHKTPLSRGGSNDPKNLQLLCRAHNQLKGSGFR